MPTAKQIAWRKKFKKKYAVKGKKKKGSKSTKSTKSKSTPVKKSTGSNRVFKRLEKLKNGGK